MDVLQRAQNRHTFDPGIYPKNEAAQFEEDRCTPLFIAALFTIAKKWKQPKCPINRWMDKDEVVHIHSGVLFSHKNKTNLPLATTWMEQEGITLSEISQP